MKTKQKVDITASILFLLLGIFLLISPHLKFNDMNILFIGIMAFYTIINFGKFILTKEFHDYEGIFSALASLLVGFIALFYKTNEKTIHLAILLFGWIILESFIKLKKADYYNDRKSKLWILEISLLIIFIVLGILTCINLNYEESVKILLLGFFFFTHGLLEFIDPIIIYLTKVKIKK